VRLFCCILLFMSANNVLADSEQPADSHIPDSCSKECPWSGASRIIPKVNKLDEIPKENPCIIYKDSLIVLLASCDTLKLVKKRSREECIIAIGAEKSRCLDWCQKNYKQPDFIKFRNYFLIEDIWLCPGDIGRHLFLNTEDCTAVEVRTSDYVSVTNHALQWNDDLLTKSEIKSKGETFWTDLINLHSCCFYPGKR
jgi:hypothetical protein